jgi:hypothetical protein
MAEDKRKKSVFAMAKRSVFASIGWEASDVRRFRPHWSEQQATEFLKRVEQRLAAATLLAGWAALEALIAEYEKGNN